MHDIRYHKRNFFNTAVADIVSFPVFEPPELYSQMHTALSLLDNEGLTLNDIQGDYTAKILYPNPG